MIIYKLRNREASRELRMTVGDNSRNQCELKQSKRKHTLATKYSFSYLFIVLFRRFSVQKCSACSQGITSKELVMRARDHVYHIGCFACDRCKRMLATGEYFGMRGMRIYCKEDYEELLREESRSGKTSSSSKGRPRKRRLATTLESVNALSGKRTGWSCLTDKYFWLNRFDSCCILTMPRFRLKVGAGQHCRLLYSLLVWEEKKK